MFSFWPDDRGLGGVLLPWAQGSWARPSPLRRSDRRLLAVDAFLGCFLGRSLLLRPEFLSVISQTLILSPWCCRVSALLAQRLLAAAASRNGFGDEASALLAWACCGNLAGGRPGWWRHGRGNGQPGRRELALWGTGLFRRAVTGRMDRVKRFGPGRSLWGLASSLSALDLRPVLALLLLAWSLRAAASCWWVVGVIGLFGLTLSLGSELPCAALRRAAC